METVVTNAVDLADDTAQILNTTDTEAEPVFEKENQVTIQSVVTPRRGFEYSLYESTMSRFAQKTGQHGPFTRAIDIVEASIEQETELDTAFIAS